MKFRWLFVLLIPLLCSAVATPFIVHHFWDGFEEDEAQGWKSEGAPQWRYSETGGFYPLGTFTSAAAKVVHNTPGTATSLLITPWMDLSNAEHPYLEFRAVTAGRTEVAPTLTILWSTGDEWHELTTAGNTASATEHNQLLELDPINQLQSWEPEYSDYQIISVTIRELGLKPRVRFAFRLESSQQGVVWVDDVRVITIEDSGFWNLSSSDVSEASGLKISYAPDGNLLLFDNPTRKAQVHLFDLSGRTVWQKRFSGTQLHLPANNLPTGIYLLSVSGDNLAESLRYVVR